MCKFKNQDDLNWLIQKYKLTTKTIAEVCGVSPNTVKSWRTFNMRKSIPDKHLRKLESVFPQLKTSP